MIYKDKIERWSWEIVISHHAFRRAIEREITPDMIEATLKGGRIERFGKNGFKFIMTYKRGRVICVGERKKANLIKILTIEWG